MQEQDRGVSVSLDVTIRYGYRIHEVVKATQAKIKEVVEAMTGLTVLEVNIAVKSLSIH